MLTIPKPNRSNDLRRRVGLQNVAAPYDMWRENPERKMQDLRKKPPGFDMWLQGGNPREIDATKGVPTQLIPADWCSDATPVSLSKEHGEEHGNQVHPTASYKASKHVAIFAQTDALAAAMESILSDKLKDYTFSRIKKMSERPVETSIASLGLPFIPGNDEAGTMPSKRASLTTPPRRNVTPNGKFSTTRSPPSKTCSPSFPASATTSSSRSPI